MSRDTRVHPRMNAIVIDWARPYYLCLDNLGAFIDSRVIKRNFVTPTDRDRGLRAGGRK